MLLLPFASHLNEIECKQLFHAMEITYISYWQIWGKNLSKLAFAFKNFKGETNVCLLGMMSCKGEDINPSACSASGNWCSISLWPPARIRILQFCGIYWDGLPTAEAFQLYTKHLHLGAFATWKLLFHSAFYFYNIFFKYVKQLYQKRLQKGCRWLTTTG